MATIRPFSRLPAHPSPVHYDLDYTWVDMDTCAFEGTVAVRLSPVADAALWTSDSGEITLHAANLRVRSATLRGSAKSVKCLRYETDFEAQTVTLSFPPLPRGPDETVGLLTIEFAGELNEQLAGFYKSIVSPGKIMGVTQFEATDARRAFPCWDEPARKATFKLSLTTSPAYRVISNTRTDKVSTKFATLRNGLKREEKTWSFLVTPTMSTYVLAWVVADCFDSLSETSTRTNIETIVYVPKGKTAEGVFALRTGVEALDFFAQLFDIPYPLSLQQHLAVPDFAAGAMENWGCITYREARLLVDENSTTNSAKRDCARVVCHEISHMWFGNHTTMTWWTDLFLNEGFARFCEFLAVAEIHPGFNAWLAFDLDVLGAALRLDALRSSHAIRVDVSHPDEINEIFDAISYAKGACLIRMLTRFLPGGQDEFFAGVRKYLKKFAFANAESKDLWEALEANPGETKVAEFCQSWTSNVGYPLLVVSTEGSRVAVRQRRFLSLGASALDDTDKQTKWTLPVALQTETSPKSTLERFNVTPASVFEEASSLNSSASELETRLSALESSQSAFLLNAELSLFRVAYTQAQYERLSAKLQSFDPRARLGLLRDAFDCAESGDVSIKVPLTLALQALRQGENDVACLLVLARGLNRCADLYQINPRIGTNFVTKLVKPFFTSLSSSLGDDVLGGTKLEQEIAFLGGNPDAGMLDELRVQLVKGFVAACEAEPAADARVLREARAMALAHCRGQQACRRDLRAIVFKTSLMSTTNDGEREDEAVLAALLERYEGGAEAMEKREILAALGGVRRETLLRRVLDFIKSPSVRAQDVPLAIAAVAASSPFNGKYMWNDFKTNFLTVWLPKFGDQNFLWNQIVGSVAGGATTVEEVRAVERFFAEEEGKGHLGTATRGLKQAAERVQANEAQIGRDEKELLAWWAKESA